MSDTSRIGTNTGHGHVWKRPDDVVYRCGGPGLCSVCSADQAVVDRATKRCPSCDHLITMHEDGGCRFVVAEVWDEQDGCQCSKRLRDIDNNGA